MIQTKFRQNEWDMIQDILKNGRSTTWSELAIRYDIKPNLNPTQRKKCANDTWRKYKKLETQLTVVKENYNGKDKLTSYTKRLIKQKTPSLEGMVIEKITTNPYGGEYISYKKADISDTGILNAVEKLLSKYSNPKEKVVYLDLNETKHGRLAVVNLYDAHLDKIPIKSSCGVESSVENNIQIFLNTVDRIILELLKQDVDDIIFPVGNDLFHTNGFNSQTKKGTQIEYYGSPEDNYYLVADAITEAITRLALVAKNKVKVIMVKGNHDEDKITVLGYWLEKYFKHTNVEVDFLRRQRKYIKFGENLLGFAHGDKEKSKIAQLPLIMATEAKELWGMTTYRKMYLGDLHHGFEYQFLKAKDMPGVEVEYLRTVGTTDSWHEDFGWIGIPKTAYLQVFDAEEGEVIRQKFNIK
jgi:hypothetical protein